MPATIFSGNNVKALKSNLDLNGVTKILSVNADPASGAGVAAPLGSIAMDYLAGKVYKKTGSLDTEWQELGSGIGGINYIENSDAESGTSGWSTYADAAGSAPVDGTGGTANITWSRSTTSPLRGVADFNLVKDAVNRQGQGVSYDFTIDSADQAKILTISADYEVLSGTFATGDLAVYVIQDPAGTPVVLQPAGYQVTAATVGNKLRLAATFQTASNVTSYRLCIHVASTSALAYTLAFDSIAVSPQQVVYGAPVTDWQEYTMSITATTTNPTLPTSGVVNNKALWRRVGDSVQIIYVLETGTVSGGNNGSGTYLFALPAGLSIDTGKVPSTGTINKPLGVARLGTNRDGLVGYVPTISTNRLIVSYETSGIDLTACDNAVALMTTNNQALMFEAQVPILGWSSSVVVSSSTDTRVVDFVGSIPSQSLTANVTNVSLTTVKDSHGSWSTNQFIVPVPGDYVITGTAVSASATVFSLDVYINGAAVASLGANQTATAGRLNVSTVLPNLLAGQILTIRSNVSINLAASSVDRISIFRLSGPSQIAASETVAARYYTVAGPAINNTVPTITYGTKVYDSHGAMSGNTYTVPVSGKYRVTQQIVTAPASFAAGVIVEGYIAKNGTTNAALGGYRTSAALTGSIHANGSAELDCIAGDQLTFKIYSDTASTLITGFTTYNNVTISRIGN